MTKVTIIIDDEQKAPETILMLNTLPSLRHIGIGYRSNQNVGFGIRAMSQELQGYETMSHPVAMQCKEALKEARHLKSFYLPIDTDFEFLRL